MIARLIILTWAVTLIGGCAPKEADLQKSEARKISGEELRSLLPGNTVTGMGSQGAYTATYRADGSVAASGGRGTVNGTWRVKDGALCHTFANVRGGSEFCGTVYRVGPNKYQQCEAGACRTTFSLNS